MNEEQPGEERRLRRDDSDVSSQGLGPDSLVLDTYLRSAHGFLVDTTAGREVGVVDEVVIDASTGVVVALEVCSGWFGRRRTVIPVADVREVSPALRQVVVVAPNKRD